MKETYPIYRSYRRRGATRLVTERARHGSGQSATATFDGSYSYRYLLTRTWDGRLPSVTFIMLNPSRADAAMNDPTIARSMSLSRSMGFGSLEVVNLFALLTPYPEELSKSESPIGPLNDEFIAASVLRSSKTVIAWGNWGALKGRDREVLALLSKQKLYAFAVTMKKQPKHPLYVPGSVRLIEW